MRHDPTLDWYAAHADAFAADALSVDLGALRDAFLARLPPNARVLDLGCGAGRDAAAFLARGCRVSAMDPSPELAARTASPLGIDVTVARAQDLDADAAYDGVWACASLLHVPIAETPAVLARIARALAPGGVLYASYKHGEGERWREGRFFHDETPSSLGALLRAAGFVPHRVWLSADARPGRAHERWVNALARRT